MMDGKHKRVGLWAVAFAGLVLAGAWAAGAAGAARPLGSTYKVTFSELGLPSGTNWSVTFNSVSMYSKTATITFTGISSGGYYWSVTTPVAGSTGVQYAASPSGNYLYVPSQTGQFIVFQQQDLLSFVDQPSSAGFTSPGYSTWYTAGSELPIAASHYAGYAFKGWSSSAPGLTFGSKTQSSTYALVNAPATITATFKTVSSKVSFSEVGLPSGTSWSVTFNGVSYIGTTATIGVGSYTVGGYSWSIPTVSASAGVQYAPTQAYGGLSVPYQTQQTVVFVKQFQLSFAVSPSAGGSTSPSSTTYVTNGSSMPIEAYSTGTTVFSSWSSSSASVTLANKSLDGTAVTVGDHATLTAKFVTGTPCTTCAVSFTEVGLPTGTSWGVTFNGAFYSGHAATIKITGVTAYTSWSTAQLIASGTPGVAWGTATTYGYLDVPYQTHQTIVYTPEYWVSVLTTPAYTGSAGISGQGSSGYYPAGAVLPLYAVGTDYASFHQWSTSAKALKVASTKSAATTLTVGATGTVTATFVAPSEKLSFTEFNLPAGTTWGIGVYTGAWTYYYSNQSTINVLGVAATYSVPWSVVSPIAGSSAGVEWAAVDVNGGMNPVYQPAQPIVFQEQVQVTIQAGGTTGGSVSPSGTSYYAYGTVLAVDALNSTTVNFTAWNSSTGSIAVASTAHAATTITILGTGTITAKFH